MSEIDTISLEAAIRVLPSRYKGPGGAVGVVKDGVVILRHAWGYADLESRVPMTAETLLPICSISKQFTCAVLLDVAGDPSTLDKQLVDLLPNLEMPRPTVADLCNMQSGLRDYWALTVLQGAMADGIFREEDARPILTRMCTTHFTPGKHYSYSNGNFRILHDLIEAKAGRRLAELYRERIFERAGMETAYLASDTGAPLNGVKGYEGNEDVGYFPATNRIFWSGDAGIAATLDDMLAWERFIDSTRSDADGLYNRLSAPQPFSNGAPSHYGFGLAREKLGDVALTGHGGALRGFRCRRLHAASRRLSVVVMFNHEADAHAASLFLMRAALGQPEEPVSGERPVPEWGGNYLESATGLVLEVTTSADHLVARFAGSEEKLILDADGIARSKLMTLERTGDAIRLRRPGENLDSVAIRVSGDAMPDIEGRFYSREIDASLQIVSAGGAYFVGFEGYLGSGAMHPMSPVGEDVWSISCRRSMDAPAPGDWTVQVRRDASGQVGGLAISCWLARNVEYAKID
ncbi:D-aminopeptidase [Rhizobiaceae bacterium n13]|uniref:D-aminopeptidase n=1 Tax=Ferirhizobium litorale TaxID=2927786 RepID=A0AAE3QC03_9HYPH|nr:D-aminopeptidase [Fererhizobium litorale]MDI7861607.1 D-aminopeptidase [Fererhizobium litorale]MDI7922051.1 D-aminopeptidase [Fererhizobium litorale]